MRAFASGVVGALALSAVAAEAVAHESTTWELIRQGGKPALMSMASAWYPPRGRVVIYGGLSTNGLKGNDDMYEWDGADWLLLCGDPSCAATRPPGRDDAGLVYDSARSRLVMFGGSTGPNDYSNDLWEFDGNTWSAGCTGAPCTDSVPGRRGIFGFTYDDAHHRVVLFGGSTVDAGVGMFGDTWTWDGAVWTEEHPAAHPSARAGCALVWDAERQRVLLVGGIEASGYASDTWEWDGTNWELKTTGAPRLQRAVAVFDSLRRKVVLHGVTDELGNPSKDTWEWDGAGWELRNQQGPSNSAAMPMAFDDVRRRVVLFHDDQTWEYHARGTACADSSECETPFCSQGVCCEATCSGICEVCTPVPGALAEIVAGVCAAVTQGPSPACNGDDACSASGQCLLAQGRPCNAGANCASSWCTSGVCCEAESCGAYACGSTGACLVACAGETDCAGGFHCNALGVCAKVNAVCDGGHTLAFFDGTTKDCAPYRCTLEGSCRETCASALDCAESLACSSAGQCVAPRDAEVVAATCACRTSGFVARGTHGWILLTLWLVALGARRRSRRARNDRSVVDEKR